MTFAIYYTVGMLYVWFVMERLSILQKVTKVSTKATTISAAIAVIAFFALIWPALFINHLMNTKSAN